MCEKTEKIFAALERNNITPIYAETAADAVKIVEDMLPADAAIRTGGSVTLVESGIWELINNPKYNFVDRNRQGITPQEREAVYQATVGCDYYFCSVNALTENGEIVNVDGNCNRISALAFGPKKVVLVVGKNKLVSNLEEAFIRVKKIAAPKNCVRLGLNNPCVKLGHCVSLLKTDTPQITDGCDSKSRICRNYLIGAPQQDPERVMLIYVNQDLGY